MVVLLPGKSTSYRFKTTARRCSGIPPFSTRNAILRTHSKPKIGCGSFVSRVVIAAATGSGRGSAWLERLVRDQEVGGSNPLAPTKFLKDLQTANKDTRVQKGSVFGSYSDSSPAPLGGCSPVLNHLLSDDFDSVDARSYISVPGLSRRDISR